MPHLQQPKNLPMCQKTSTYTHITLDRDATLQDYKREMKLYTNTYIHTIPLLSLLFRALSVWTEPSSSYHTIIHYGQPLIITYHDIASSECAVFEAYRIP